MCFKDLSAKLDKVWEDKLQAERQAQAKEMRLQEELKKKQEEEKAVDKFVQSESDTDEDMENGDTPEPVDTNNAEEKGKDQDTADTNDADQEKEEKISSTYGSADISEYSDIDSDYNSQQMTNAVVHSGIVTREQMFDM